MMCKGTEEGALPTTGSSTESQFRSARNSQINASKDQVPMKAVAHGDLGGKW